MTRFYLLFSFVVLLAIHGYAQQSYTLSGTVRDSATGRPLVRAAIVIDYEKTTNGTDNDGNYSIKVLCG
ncbi:hypothetical protein [Telluribacter sp.]|jgi:hypothetical protein|uniref:hypothetical protein n=1 Tax=Telluribacter sp. TaxID=1978767 RepID=UPI002E0FB066|nr:hypothetical protein [Telluribacter sp.]